MKVDECIYKPPYHSIYGYLFEGGSESFLYADKEAVIFFVYSGELAISYQNEKIILKKGEYAFVKCNIIINIMKKDIGLEPFNGIYMGFNKWFLWDIYKNFCYQPGYFCPNNFEQNIIKLPSNPYLQSLYISLKTYLEYGEKPSPDILQLKMLEAVHSLTLTDKRFFTCLFCFIYPFNERH